MRNIKTVLLFLILAAEVGCSHDVKSLRHLIRGGSRAMKAAEGTPMATDSLKDDGLINFHKCKDSLGYKYYSAIFLLPTDTVGFHMHSLQMLPAKLKPNVLPATYLIRATYIPSGTTKLYLLNLSVNSAGFEPLK